MGAIGFQKNGGYRFAEKSGGYRFPEKRGQGVTLYYLLALVHILSIFVICLLHLLVGYNYIRYQVKNIKKQQKTKKLFSLLPIEKPKLSNLTLP